jgi:hypothetical protein
MSLPPSISLLEVRRFLVMHEPREGLLNYTQLRAFTEEVGEALCGRPGRIVVDGRDTPKAYTFSEAYRLVQEFKDAPCFRSGRVAILNDYDRSFEKTQSVEFFAQEEGLAIKAFIDYDRAVGWLLIDESGTLGPLPA